MHPSDDRFWEKLVDKDDRWRKKRKDKADYQTIDAVLDKNTSEILLNLYSQDFLKSITGTIASGKESGVFLASLGKKGKIKCQELSVVSPIVIKIFRTSTLNFRSIEKYLSGDFRFKKYSKKTRHVINLWTEKEFRNLNRSYLAGIKVPKPILVKKNVLLMELIGTDGIPSPLLKTVPEEATSSLFEQIIDQMTVLFQKADLIHADLSPYNILIKEATPYFIDMSQGVLTTHPRAKEFLKRDLVNILTFFNAQGVDTPDTEELLVEISNKNQDDKDNKKG
jgi:RIO kinase 1